MFPTSRGKVLEFVQNGPNGPALVVKNNYFLLSFLIMSHYSVVNPDRWRRRCHGLDVTILNASQDGPMTVACDYYLRL